jgi:hypothetical protein
MSDEAWPWVQYGSPPPSDLDDAISDEEDGAYEYESEEDITTDYPELSDDESGPGCREGLELLRPHDTLFNYRRYHVRQLMYGVRAFEKGRTCHSSFAAFWRVNRIVGFLPVRPTEDRPTDPWPITKKELQRILRNAYTKASGMVSEGFGDDLMMMKTALPYAPTKLPKRRAVRPDLADCQYPCLGMHAWNHTFRLTNQKV